MRKVTQLKVCGKPYVQVNDNDALIILDGDFRGSEEVAKVIISDANGFGFDCDLETLNPEYLWEVADEAIDYLNKNLSAVSYALIDGQTVELSERWFFSWENGSIFVGTEDWWSSVNE